MLKPCDLVLADEPTGSLDTTNADLVLAKLRELNAGGKTMIIVTHDDRVAAECDRVIDLPDPRSAIEPSESGGSLVPASASAWSPNRTDGWRMTNGSPLSRTACSRPQRVAM